MAFDDPTGSLQFTPLDAIDTDWEYVLEIKQPNGTHFSPKYFDGSSNGIWIQYHKYHKLLEACGIFHKVKHPFRYGMIVYAFPNQDILSITASKIQSIYRHQNNKAFRKSVCDSHWVDDYIRSGDGKIQDLFSVPSYHWNYLGNMKTGELVTTPYFTQYPAPATEESELSCLCLTCRNKE